MNAIDENISARSGYYVSLVTAITTIITFGIAFMTPPLSGPFCVAGCFEYPYSEIASRFPRDYYWMYLAIVVTILFVIQMIIVNNIAGSKVKIFSHTGVAFSIISATILISNYFTQVSVVQPSLLNGETEGIALLTQFNPHGTFIALEEIGFLLMTFAFFVTIPVFAKKGGVYKAVRLTYLIGFLLGIASLVYISIKLGTGREYIFEVIIISIVWLELIITSFLLSIIFKRSYNSKH